MSPKQKLVSFVLSIRSELEFQDFLPSHFCVEFPQCKKTLPQGHYPTKHLCFWKQIGDLSGTFLFLENKFRYPVSYLIWVLTSLKNSKDHSQCTQNSKYIPSHLFSEYVSGSETRTPKKKKISQGVEPCQLPY